MLKYTIIILFFLSLTILTMQAAMQTTVQAKGVIGTLSEVYKNIFSESVKNQRPIFPVKSINDTDQTFNQQLLLSINQTIKYFTSKANKKITYKNLYELMEEYVNKNSIFNADASDDFKGCRATLHRGKKKTCISLQSIYVVPYSNRAVREHLINRYFNSYIVSADNSTFFSVDIYEKTGLGVYKQKRWRKNLYSVPEEKYRALYIDKKYFTKKKENLFWFCSNSYNPFGPNNNQLCNLLKTQIHTFKVGYSIAHLFSSFSTKENSSDIKIQQEKVVEYSKVHDKIFNSNNESSYFTTAVGKNKHLFIYSNSVYCSEDPKVKNIYKININNVQDYVCIGEDDSAYFSNYKLLGIEPKNRGHKEEEDDDGFFY